MISGNIMKTSDALAMINNTILSLKAYHLEPRDVAVKLNQNENPFDWPDTVKQEVAKFCLERPWNRYPPFIPDKLKNALADYTGVSSQQIIIGNGSNEMLLVLFLALVNNNSRIILCKPTFTVYQMLVDGFGAQGISINLNKNLQFNIPEIIDTIEKNPGSILILCSPNNPTGSVLNEDSLRLILKKHTGFFILDQAYIEFGGYNAISLIDEFPNLIITRTFSKALAGAGLRLGYMIGSAGIIKEINKIKLPYNINFFSEHVASVLLNHQDLLDRRIKEIISERDKMSRFFNTMPFCAVYPGNANFILVRTKKKNDLFNFLCSEGFLVRDVSGYPMLENCLRISVGTPKENSGLIKVVKRFFEKN